MERVPNFQSACTILPLSTSSHCSILPFTYLPLIVAGQKFSLAPLGDIHHKQTCTFLENAIGLSRVTGSNCCWLEIIINLGNHMEMPGPENRSGLRALPRNARLRCEFVHFACTVCSHAPPCSLHSGSQMSYTGKRPSMPLGQLDLIPHPSFSAPDKIKKHHENRTGSERLER